MRVLLCSANKEHFPEPVFPVGLAYLSSALMGAGAAVRILDAGTVRFLRRALAGAVEDFRPDVIGLSLRNADNASWPCTVSYVEGYRRIARCIRSVTDVPLALGGAAFSIFPRELQEQLQADGGFLGDGEVAAGLILDRAFQGGRIEKRHLETLDRVGFPRSIGKVFPSIRKYRTFGVQTARGCPHGCIYCTYPLLEGRRLRARDPQAVVEDIRLLQSEAEAGDFFIVDSTFNAREDHMVSVLEALRSAGLKARFSCYMTPKVSDPGVFSLLAEAGCVGVDFGTDSGSPAVLSALRKSFSADDVLKTSEWCRRAGIDFCHSLIFGGPGETRATVDETVGLMDRASPRAVIAMTGMRIYPRTDLEEQARREGLIDQGSLLRPRFYSRGNSLRDVASMVSAAAARRNSWFLPGKKYWSSSLPARLFRLLHQGEGPLWRHL